MRARNGARNTGPVWTPVYGRAAAGRREPADTGARVWPYYMHTISACAAGRDGSRRGTRQLAPALVMGAGRAQQCRNPARWKSEPGCRSSIASTRDSTVKSKETMGKPHRIEASARCIRRGAGAVRKLRDLPDGRFPRLTLPGRPRTWAAHLAQVAELVDAHGSGPCAARRGGSSPLLGTKAFLPKPSIFPRDATKPSGSDFSPLNHTLA